MNRQVITIIVGVFIVIVMIWLLPSQDDFIHTQSEAFAKEWVEKKLETYVNGDSNLQLIEDQNLGSVDCHLCYLFTYSFDTWDTDERQTHTIAITMVSGRITKKILDGSPTE